MHRKSLLRSGAGLAALAIATAACGSTAGGSGASGGSHSATAGASMPASTSGITSTTAAQLYSSLDELLTEHVDLTASVVQTAVTTSPSSPSTKAALAALDQNTQALGKAFGSVYGPAAQRQFLSLWRAHIGFFVNYTIGMATHDQARVAAAQKDLSGYSTQFAAFVSGATRLPRAAVAADLQGHVSTLEAAISAIVSKSPDAGTKLEMAAMHMGGTAQVLAQGIASSKGLPGNVTGAGSALRAALTGLLVQHVAATGFVVQTAIAAGGNLSNPEVQGAISALSDNTSQLGKAFGSVYGPAAQQQFLSLWRAHIGFFVNYTTGLATGNSAQVRTAQKDLGGYISGFAGFVSGATRLPRAAVAADLQGHVSTLEAAIKSVVTKSPDATATLMMAETHMAGTGAVLAQGIASSMPAKFTS